MANSADPDQLALFAQAGYIRVVNSDDHGIKLKNKPKFKTYRVQLALENLRWILHL